MSNWWCGICIGLLIGAVAGFMFCALVQIAREDKFWRDRLSKRTD